MGDRISIQFMDSCANFSPPLYSHWSGFKLVAFAMDFIQNIHPESESGEVMVKFIQSDYARKIDDLHIECDIDGDNDDHGNCIIDIQNKIFIRRRV